MQLINQAVQKPIAVIACVLLVVMFGILALNKIPIQLTPDVSKPVIQITTIWPGTAPEDIEREITNRQEEVLKGLTGLKQIISNSTTGRAEITLEFSHQQNMDRALLSVANRLDRVTDYPEEADEPFLRLAAAEDSPIAWIVLRRQPGNETPIHHYGDFAEEVIQDRLERVPGVARVNVFGGSELEMQLQLEPEKLASYGLTVTELLQALRNANISLSAGDIDEGKRRYVVRTEGDFSNLDQVREVYLRSTVGNDGQLERVSLADVATPILDYKKPTSTIRHFGEPIIAVNAVRERGANVIETMRGLKAAIAELNEEILPKYELTFKQVYDETIYIDSAINLVQQNIFVGGILAALILMIFLRSGRATLIISLAIPVSIVGSFVAMAAMGRSINVISLAGLAFAVGMVVDAAIVVLENIYRHRQLGKSASEAAIVGAKEVWQAILVSALTTVVVFIPLLTLELEVGQLFRDIAVAITVSVLLSLVVAITVVPALAAWLLKEFKPGLPFPQLQKLDHFAHRFVSLLLNYLSLGISRPKQLGLVVAGMTLLACLSAWLMLPKLEYLPEGNRNFVFGVILPPPGYNLGTTTKIAERLEAATKPFWAPLHGPKPVKGQPPKIGNFFFVARNNTTFTGAIAVQDQAHRASELVPILSAPIFQEPGTFGFVTQPSLFGRSVGGGRSIELDVIGPELPVILATAGQMVGQVSQLLPREQGNQLRPIPGLELGAPEVQVVPNYLKLKDNGLTATDLALAVRTFNDGLRAAEITVQGKRIDLTVKGKQDVLKHTQDVAKLPVITQQGTIVPVESLAEIKFTAGPTEIRHKNRVRTVTVEIRPATQLPLEQAMKMLDEKIIKPFNQQLSTQNVTLKLAGTADQLTQTWEAMVWEFWVAIFVVYLVMSILFQNFFYPLIILFSVPVAAAGGILGLWLLNLFRYQALDMLTLLGFVILIGIVVNNAILIVHNTLQNFANQETIWEQAVLAATKTRVRPIFMSTLTSVFGMLPLVLFPGAGSELYRGLGSVIVGGLTTSAILTLILVPGLMLLTHQFRVWYRAHHQ